MCSVCSSTFIDLECENCGKDVCHSCTNVCRECNVETCVDCGLIDICDDCETFHCQDCYKKCHIKVILIVNRALKNVHKIIVYHTPYIEDNQIYIYRICYHYNKYTNASKTVELKIVKAIRLLRIAMKRRYIRNRSTLKSRCKHLIKRNKIEYENENIPQDLKEYLDRIEYT